MKNEHKANGEGGSGQGDDDGKWVPRRLTGEYRADSEDAVAVAATGARLSDIAPLLQGVSDRASQSEYLRLAVQFEEIRDACSAIAEGLRIRAEIKWKRKAP